MIKITLDKGLIIVDHDCEGKSEKQIAAELVQALDFLCADLYVDNPLLNNEEKIGKALETRNNILDQMKNIEYSCEEYFETDGEIERVPYNKECNYNRTESEPCICFYCLDNTCEMFKCRKCIAEKKSFEKPCCSCSGFIEPSSINNEDQKYKPVEPKTIPLKTPDRIIVGELNSREALELLDKWNKFHNERNL